MELIILSLIAALLGLFFLIIGIYQIKTNRIPFKTPSSSVNSPRELSVLFTYLGVLGLALACNFFFWTPMFEYWSISVSPDFTIHMPSIFAVIAIIVGLAGPILLTVIGVYDLVKKRVFAVKATPRTNKKIAKFSRPIGVTSIVSGTTILIGTVATFFTGINNGIVDTLFLIGIVCVFVMCILISIVEEFKYE